MSDTSTTISCPGLWDANDVARYLKVSRSWVYQRAQSGLLPCLHVGGLLRFEPDAIQAFIRGEAPAGKAGAVSWPGPSGRAK